MWIPAGTKCPEDIDRQELDELVQRSIALDDDPASCRRYVLRRASAATQFFATKPSGTSRCGRPVMHGHPISAAEVPPPVARTWRDRGEISQPEYKRIVLRRLG